MFWIRQPAPAHVATDTVFPLKFLDDSIINRAFVMNPLYIYDDLLDVDKLRSSLERLVQREGFRKLGARLRKNVRSPHTPVVQMHMWLMQCLTRSKEDMSIIFPQNILRSVRLSDTPMLSMT